MRPRRLLLLLAVLLCFVAARRRAVPTPEREPIPDVFSASNPTHVKSTHLSLDLTVDFNAQILRGFVTHTLVNLDGADQFIVDTNGLLIDAVTANGRSAPWSYGPSAANGQPMIIAIDPKTTSVRIDYHTTPTANGLHWLKAQETRSRVQPALWSENEPYMARSWIPLQDTPSVRVTYDATIHAPAGELALMSAANNPTTPRNDGVYTFSMPHSIPSYLIALTVAKYEFRDMGNRTGVYAEPSLIADTVYDDPNDQSGLLVDDWIYGSFLPSNVSPKPSSAYLARVTAQANAFRAGTKASDLDVTGWTEFEWGQFLLQIQDVIVPRMSELDSAFGFSKMITPPQSWLTAAASSLDAPSKALLDRYLAIGKVDSVNTWYALSRSAAGRTYGVPLYNNVRNFYDANTRILITSYFSALP
jgi:hypothetical protein